MELMCRHIHIYHKELYRLIKKTLCIIILISFISFLSYCILYQFSTNKNISIKSKFIVKNGNYLYYSLSRDSLSPSLIIRIKENKTEREEIYKDERYLGYLYLINNNLLCIGAAKEDYDGNNFILDLKNKKIYYPIDVSKFYKNSIFSLNSYKNSFYFLVENNLEDNKEQTLYDLYKKSSDGKYNLLASKIQLSYNINGDSIYYIKNNFIYSMDCNGDKIRKILDLTERIYDFNIYNEKLFLTNNNNTFIYDLKSNTKVQFEQRYWTWDIIFEKDYFYCADIDGGLYKNSYDGKKRLKLSNLLANSITLINNFIYFIKPEEYDEKNDKLNDAIIYRIKTDGSNLEEFD